MIRELVVAVPQEKLSRAWLTPLESLQFSTLTGIHNTWRTPGGSTTDLALAAAREIKLRDVGAVICVTQTPDRQCPPMAYAVAEALKLSPSIPMLDVNHACAGFIYAVWLARRIAQRTLIVVVDRLRMSTGQPKMNFLLFSDAAAAVVFDATPAGPTWFMNDPSGQRSLFSTSFGMEMDGASVFDFVISTVPGMIRRYSESLPFTPHDLLVQHQANLTMMRKVAKGSGFEGRSVECIEDYGNTSSVSIPCALAACEQQVMGKYLLLAGYGAGWSAAVTNMRYPDTSVARMIRV